MKALPGFNSTTGDWLRLFSRVTSALVVLMGTLVFAGWALKIRALILLFPGGVAMNPVAAALFVLAGLSLCLSELTESGSNRALHGVGIILGCVVGLAGALQVAHYGFDVPLDLEHLLFSRRVGAGRLPPAEFAPNTAINFLLCGLGLLLIKVESRRGIRPAQIVVLAAGLITMLALIGYTYRVISLYRLGGAMPMALETAIAFALFCLGFLAAHPHRGVMTVLTSHTTGGAVARRLLPVALLIPWIIGALLLVGEQSGYYPREVAVSIFAVACIVIFTSLIWWNANLLYFVDIQRMSTERRLAMQHNLTRTLAEASTFEDAGPKILQIIGAGLEWEFGALWMIDPTAGKMRCVHTWTASPNALAEFIQSNRQLAFNRGEGLPGRVWIAGRPVWLADVPSEKDLACAPFADKAGLHGAFAFPVLLGQDLLGAVEFYSQRIEPPDAMLVEMLTGLGSQIGQFIERTRAEEQLRRTTANLERSNTDLQQFAYVASHDLFEPLRMVVSYLQLLNERYKPSLDKQAQEFIRFAVEGGQRMQALINDLLAYSRVEMRGRPFQPTECEQALKAALANLKVAIEETQASVIHQPLPKVLGDSIQLTQLFQNLIGNGLKFHGPEPPRIEIGAHQSQDEWVFSVRDNGIGIDPKHFERIFVIFQRLHTRREYPGTGIGLAICKKIVERHGGRIWIQSAPGQGSTFFFTLPVMKGP